MELRRLLIALLCLPALLAPSGFSAVLCLCDAAVWQPEREGCCARAEPSCCCEAPLEDGDPVQAHAPCSGCRDLTTPVTPATRAPSTAGETLEHSTLAPLPKSFSFALLAGAPNRAVTRPSANHAPPRQTPIPLRI